MLTMGDRFLEAQTVNRPETCIVLGKKMVLFSVRVEAQSTLPGPSKGHNGPHFCLGLIVGKLTKLVLFCFISLEVA